MVLYLEITTTTSDGRQNIKSWIQNHIICRTTMDWRSYRINTFKSDRIPNISLKHFIDGKITLVSFIAWNCGNILSTTSLEPSQTFPQLFIVKTYHSILWKSIFPNHHRYHHPSTLYHPSLYLIFSRRTVELHTLHPILSSPRWCMKTWQYYLLTNLNYLGLLY